MKIVQSIKLLLAVMVITIAAGSASAQMPVAGVPQFVPVDVWNVQQTTLSQVRGLQGVKLPCMMANGYDNGFILRMSGGGQNMLAMAIDFRQGAFKRGRQYSATIGIDDSYTQQAFATAFSDSVLIFNLRKLSGFYQMLRGGATMELAIEGNVMRFGLGNIAQGIDQMERCYGGDPMMTTPMMQNASVPSVDRQPMGTPRGPDDESPEITRWKERVAPKPAMMGSATKSTNQNEMVWEARAGEKIKRTLEKWSRTAGVELDWQAGDGDNAVVANDLKVRGSFEDAVQSLMAQNAAAMGIEANMMGGPLGGSPYQGSYYDSPVVSQPAPTRQDYNLLPANTGNEPEVISNYYTPPAPVMAGGGRWNAPAGSNLQQVLRIWSEQAGVAFSWQSHTGFMVKRAVSANGSYEDALQSLLNQYSSDDIRPAAQLNNDPVTGQRMLFVESTRI